MLPAPNDASAFARYGSLLLPNAYPFPTRPEGEADAPVDNDGDEDGDEDDDTETRKEKAKMKRVVASTLGTVLEDRYKISRHIGSGSFGQIYRATDMSTGFPVAVKTELKNVKFPQLYHEYRVYRKYRDDWGIPDVLWYGASGEQRVMVMDMLGPSLENVFDECGRRFTLKTVLMLAEHMISRVETVHSGGYVHRDIKPDNFLLPSGDPASAKTQPRVLYLIDFGLSKRYRLPGSKEHIPFKEGKSLTGTPRYASVRAHKGAEQGRRDDMTSLGHVWVYFLKGKLPWQGVKDPDAKRRYEKILEIKKETRIEDLCAGLPQEFETYFRTCADMAFEERPDYSGMRRMFRALFSRKGFERDNVYDWDVKRRKTGKKEKTLPMRR